MGCKATTKAGNACKSPPLDGTDFCISHSPRETQEKLGFDANNGKGGRKPTPRLIDVLRQDVEDRMDEVTAPFWEGLKSDNPKIAMESARELLDRSYGRPTQSTEISGPKGDPIELVKLPTDKDWEGEVARVLKQSGALDADSDQDQ